MDGPAEPTLLPPALHEVLVGGANWLVDLCFDDLTDLDDPDWDITRSSLVEHLPRRYLTSYSPRFVRRFAACVVLVAWKAVQPSPPALACLAEELALRAILDRAIDIAEERGVEAAFGAVEDALFEDTDFLLLFDPAQDGIEGSDIGRYLGIGSLGIDDWFRPFRGASDAVHPYARDTADGGPAVDRPAV